MKKLVILLLILFHLFGLYAQQYSMYEGKRYEFSGKEIVKTYRYDIINGVLMHSTVDSSYVVLDTLNRVSFTRMFYDGDCESYSNYTFKNIKGLDSLVRSSARGNTTITEYQYDDKSRVTSISESSNERELRIYFVAEYEEKQTETGSITIQTARYIVDPKKGKNLIIKTKYIYNLNGEEIDKQIIYPKQASNWKKKQKDSQSVSDTITIEFENNELNKPDELVLKYYELSKSRLEVKSKTNVNLVYQNEDKSITINFIRNMFEANPRAILIIKQTM